MLALLGVMVTAELEAQSFQGSVQYAIRVNGKDAPAFLVNEPATRMALHIKEDNYIVNLSGGQKAKTFLYVGDSNHTYIVDAANRRAFRKDYYQDTSKVIPKAIPTGKKQIIKGYECDEYKMKRPGQYIYFYVHDKYRVDTLHYHGKKKDEAKADFLTKGLDGRIPLRKIIKSPRLNIELDLLSIAPKELDIENFRIPQGFKLKGRDPRF